MLTCLEEQHRLATSSRYKPDALVSRGRWRCSFSRVQVSVTVQTRPSELFQCSLREEEGRQSRDYFDPQPKFFAVSATQWKQEPTFASEGLFDCSRTETSRNSTCSYGEPWRASAAKVPVPACYRSRIGWHRYPLASISDGRSVMAARCGFVPCGRTSGIGSAVFGVGLILDHGSLGAS